MGYNAPPINSNLLLLLIVLNCLLGGMEVEEGLGNIDLNTISGNKKIGFYGKAGVTNSPRTDISNQYGLFVQYESSNGRYNIWQDISETDKTRYFMRGAYKANNVTWTYYPWEEISYDIPSFYKDYSTLAALATGLKVSAFSDNAVKFRVMSGSIPANQEITVSCGNGLLFVGTYSGGALYWPEYWTTNINVLVGTPLGDVSVSKSASSRDVKITSTTANGYSWAYIGFTAL